MSGLSANQSDSNYVDQISHFPMQQQADEIVNYFASTRNLYDEVKSSDFPQYQKVHIFNYEENFVTPEIIINTINKINRKSACVKGDIPIKIIHTFSSLLSLPLCNLINLMFEKGIYPTIWKRELITPIPKIHPAPSIEKLRPISGIFDFEKIADRIIAAYLTSDMSRQRDIS